MEDSGITPSLGPAWRLTIIGVLIVGGAASVSVLRSAPYRPVAAVTDSSVSECPDAHEGSPSADGCEADELRIDRAITPTNVLPSSQVSTLAPHPAFPADRAHGLAVDEASTVNAVRTMTEIFAATRNTKDMLCRHDKAERRNGAEIINAAENLSRRHKNIAGRILGEDGLGIEGVKVLATAVETYGEQDIGDTNARSRLTTVTAPGGYYSFGDLPDGNYRIQTATHGEYRSAWISVQAGLKRADLVLVPEQNVVLRGQVTDEDGEPLEGVIVLPNMVGVASASTDKDGHYTLPVALKPAATNLTLRFLSPGYLEKAVPVPATSLDGFDTPAIEVAMVAVDSWTSLTGSVLGSKGEALQGRTVQIQALGQRNSYRGSTDENGEFLFPAVEAGLDYQLRVAGGSGYPDLTRHIHVDVDKSTFDIVLEPFEYGELSGRLVNLDGAPVPDFRLALRNSASRSPNAIFSTDIDGNFVVERAPAGQLLFATRSSPSMLVRGLRLEAGDELQVPLVIDWGDHEIRGLIVDRRGNPVPASEIVLTWSHDSGGIRSTSIRRTISDAQGNFVFQSLGPGPHRLEVKAPDRPALAVNYDASRQGYDLTVRMN